MANPCVFISAADARQNPIRESVVHEEACAIETAILNAVKNGLYEAKLSSGSPMTGAGTIRSAITSVDLNNNQMYVPGHPFKTGDLVTVSSNGALPAPLLSTEFYSVIYIDPDYIKLAANPMDASNSIPLNIDFTAGVISIDVNEQGAGYLTVPIVTVDESEIGSRATATAILSNYGRIENITVISHGSGFTDIPTIDINSRGSGATVGAISFVAVGAGVATGGYGYREGDILSITGGTGLAATLTVTGVGPNGTVTSVILGNTGLYTALPAISNAPTTAQPNGGTDCTINLTMGIGAIAVANGGSGFTGSPYVGISGGSGTGANAIARVNAGTIIRFDILDAGSGYTSSPTITIDSGNGAAAIPVLTPTGVGSITVLDNGNVSYSSTPTVTVEAVGDGAIAGQVSMRIVNAVITNAGGGYTEGDILLVVGGSGTNNASIQVTSVGAYGQIIGYSLITSGLYTFLPILSHNNVVGGSGRSATFNLTAGIDSIELLSGGSAYAASPTVKISTSNNCGTGAEVYALMNEDVVESLFVKTAGSGYTVIPEITITSGSGAVAVAVIESGSIARINVVEPGQDYTCPPIVTVEGPGTARANLVPTGIQRIDIVDPGENYVDPPEIETIPSENQLPGTLISPATVANIGYSVKQIAITNNGYGYSNIPDVVISAPASRYGIQATATAQIGAGVGTTIVSLYPNSKDYWLVWKNQDPSIAAYKRPYAERMDSVISYFTNLGYTINRTTNSVTGNTIEWKILW